MTSDALLDAFKTLLADTTFMPEGGRLGFGLKHQYPVSESQTWRYEAELCKVLKGRDHALFTAAKDAGLEPDLSLVYEITSGEGGEWLLNYVWDGSYSAEDHDDLSTEFKYDKDAEKIAPSIYDDDYDSDDSEKVAPDLEWIVPRNSNTRIGSHYIAQGNEASLETLYGDVVLIAKVPPMSQRVS